MKNIKNITWTAASLVICGISTSVIITTLISCLSDFMSSYRPEILASAFFWVTAAVTCIAVIRRNVNTAISFINGNCETESTTVSNNC